MTFLFLWNTKEVLTVLTMFDIFLNYAFKENHFQKSRTSQTLP